MRSMNRKRKKLPQIRNNEKSEISEQRDLSIDFLRKGLLHYQWESLMIEFKKDFTKAHDCPAG
jgi:hypothetical protein